MKNMHHKQKSNLKRSLTKIIPKLSSTQNLTYKPIFALNNVYTPQTIKDSSKNKFNQTIGSDAYFEWRRPQSKQGQRRIITRPQTSKGFRKNKQANVNQKLNNMKENRYDFFFEKGQLNSKSMHQSDSLKTEINQNQIDDITIEIVMNKKVQKKTKNHSNKFQTELSQDFLSLFAS